MARLIIFGASGHARVVIDAARLAGWEVIGLIDTHHLPGTLVDGVPVLGDDSAVHFILQRFSDAVAIMGIGNTHTRSRVACTVDERAPNLSFATVIHPRATVALDVTMAPGCFVAAGATINCGCRLGAHVVVNTNASVDHDVVLGDFSFIGPNAALAGGVNVGRGAFIGIGATVLPNLRIGEEAVVGAGAVVLADVPPAVTCIGNPARPIRPSRA